MKNIIFLLLVGFLLNACTQDVIIDELNNSNSKLVIEANINWDKNNPSLTQTQTIRLTLTNGYYNKPMNVIGATVDVFDKNNVAMGTFIDQNNGTYIATNFSKPVVGETYSLKITYNGNIYTANETYSEITPINSISQENINTFGEQIQVKVNLDNEIGIENYYLYRVKGPNAKSPLYGVQDDLLINETPGNNQFDITFFSDDYFDKNNIIDITVYSISKQYKNYLLKVIALSQGSANGPFTTAPSSIKGNITNTTQKENTPLGYFSINQFVQQNYLVQ